MKKPNYKKLLSDLLICLQVSPPYRFFEILRECHEALVPSIPYESVDYQSNFYRIAAGALGSMSSEAKKRTARENGKKGGRPKGVKKVPAI